MKYMMYLLMAQVYKIEDVSRVSQDPHQPDSS